MSSAGSKVSFQGPTGQTYTPGQTVQHPSGETGIVMGQDQRTGKAKIVWAHIYWDPDEGVISKMRQKLYGRCC
jgi:hypothetical protein